MTNEPTPQLFDYCRSSAAYRVRIALNLKEIAYEHRPVNLTDGAQRTSTYHGVNPQGLVPALRLEQGAILTQSLAICEYLDETYPQHPLLPTNTIGRARVRALALAIACDLHPLNNLRVLNYLTNTLKVTPEQRLTWYRDWIATELTAFEAALQHPDTRPFCHGKTPGLADLCLVPQVFNARRFDCDLSACPITTEIADRCSTLDAFAAAHPDQQPDA